jgi:hypothetical protein
VHDDLVDRTFGAPATNIVWLTDMGCPGHDEAHVESRTPGGVLIKSIARSEVTALGDEVNEAARIEVQARRFSLRPP